MRNPSPELIEALRTTADRIASGAGYQWTHQGRCNCGHLAQTLTRLSHAEIHRLAIEKAGDWSEKAYDYCPSSGFPIDHIIGTMLAMGMTRDDIRDLERLADPRVLRRLSATQRAALHHNRREDVVLYMRALADLHEEALAANRASCGAAEGEAAKRAA